MKVMTMPPFSSSLTLNNHAVPYAPVVLGPDYAHSLMLPSAHYAYYDPYAAYGYPSGYAMPNRPQPAYSSPAALPVVDSFQPQPAATVPGYLATPSILPTSPTRVSPPPAAPSVPVKPPAAEVSDPEIAAEHNYGPYYQKSHKLPYSRVLNLLEKGQIQQAKIEWHPDRLTDLPVAKLLTKDNHQIKTNLPSNIRPFVKAMDEKKVQYEFQEHRAGLGERGRHFFGQVMKDSVLPTVILTIGGLLGLGIWKYVIKPLQENAPVENALKKTIKNFDDVHHTVDAEMPLYDKPVQDTVNKFLRREKDFLLFLGPPGTGKTHLLEAVGKSSIDRPGTVVLTANVDDQDTSIRDLLQQIFSGDKVTTQKSMNVLNKIAGTQVRELVVMVNEIEQFSDVMDKIIVNGMGNPTAPIKLRILATGNQLPRMSQAANNRIQGGITYVDYVEADKQAKLAAKILGKVYPDVNTPETQQKIQAVFADYPGYSTRSLVEDVLKPIAEEAKSQANGSSPVEKLAKRMAQQHLNDAEIAGLFRQVINHRLRSESASSSKLSDDGIEFLNRKMIQVAQKSSQDLGVELLMNGKQLHKLANRALDKYIQETGFMPHNAHEYTRAIETMASELQQGNLTQSVVPKQVVSAKKSPTEELKVASPPA